MPLAFWIWEHAFWSPRRARNIILCTGTCFSVSSLSLKIFSLSLKIFFRVRESNSRSPCRAGDIILGTGTLFLVTSLNSEYYFGYGNTLFGHLVELGILFWVLEHAFWSSRRARNIILCTGTCFSVSSSSSKYYFGYGNTLFGHLVELGILFQVRKHSFQSPRWNSKYYFG